MRSYKFPKYFGFVSLIVLTMWFLSPAIAGPGDPAIARQAWPMIEAGALLIDVRSAEEYQDGHIEGAINIPHDQTSDLIVAIGADKQRPVVVYCRSGNRSSMAKAELVAKGYSGVYDATGYIVLKKTKP